MTKGATAKLAKPYVDEGDDVCYATHPINVEFDGSMHMEQICVYGSRELAEFIVEKINNDEDWMRRDFRSQPYTAEECQNDS